MTIPNIWLTFDIAHVTNEDRFNFEQKLIEHGLTTNLGAAGRTPSTTYVGAWSGTEPNVQAIRAAVEKMATDVQPNAKMRVAVVQANTWDFSDNID